MVDNKRGLFLTNLGESESQQSSRASFYEAETFDQFEARIDQTLESAKKLLREGRRDTQLIGSEL
jgi:translation elongation factor P/translation initiation factor 5A